MVGKEMMMMRAKRDTMTDRYFENFLSDFVKEQATVPGIDEDKQEDSLLKLLALPYPTLSEKLKRAALDLKETSHKSAAYFRDKPFQQYDNLCKIFGKDRATGNGATDLGEEDGIEETQRNSPIDIEGIEDIVQETQPAASFNSKRKREAYDMIDKVVEDIQLLPNIDVKKQQLKAIALLSKDHFSARAYSKMTTTQKICYVEMIAEGSISILI
ncbi:hypothetical protein LXL04_013572 [Taraxacum kok-saghyz]